MTNEEKIEIINIATGEAITSPNLELAVSNLTIESNLDIAYLELQKNFEQIRIPITLASYKYAKQNMVSCNKMIDFIKEAVKSQIETAEKTLKEIKEKAKKIYDLINSERDYYKSGYDEVFASEVKKKCKELIFGEIQFQYEKEKLENEYRIIAEQQIDKLCIVSNINFPNDKEGQFEWAYLTTKCKKEIINLLQNCLQFKQERINRIQALRIANLQAGLEENFQVTLEDIKPFLDEVEPNFTNKLKAKIQQARTKQETIKLENERKLNAEKERLKREAEAEANKQLQLAKEKQEAELKSMKIEVAEAETKIKEIEQENEDLYQKVETLLPRVDKMAHYEPAKTAEIPAHNPEVAKKPVKDYIMSCSKKISISEDEIEKVRKLYVAQGFPDVRFRQIN